MAGMTDPNREIHALAEAIRVSMSEPGYGYIDIDNLTSDEDVMEEARRLAVALADAGWTLVREEAVA